MARMMDKSDDPENQKTASPYTKVMKNEEAEVSNTNLLSRIHTQIKLKTYIIKVFVNHYNTLTICEIMKRQGGEVLHTHT